MTNPIKILLGNLKTILSFGSSNANKNVVTDANGDLKVEAKNNHSHGDITNDGKLGTTSSKPLITTTGGKIATGAFGTSSGQFAEGNHNHDGTYLKSYTPPTASTSQAGIVQLNNTVSSTSTSQAATANAVKTAYDLANGKPSLGTTSTTAAAGNHNHDGTYLKSYTPPIASTEQAGIIKIGTTANDAAAGNHTHSYTSSSDVDTKISTHNSSNSAHSSLFDSKTVTLTKLTGNNITSGYLSTYEIKQGTTSLGKIDIPKDYLVKSASVGTCNTANSPVTGYAIGDKYIDFVINTKDNSGTGEHIYIKAKDIMPTKTSDLTNDSGFITTLPTASTITAGIIKIGSTANDAAAGNHNHNGVYQPVGSYLTSSDITGKEDTTNKVKSTSSISSSSTDDQYASAKLIYNTLLKSDSTVKNGHSHGNIGNGGTLSGKSQNVVTDSSGNITTEAKLVGSSTATDIKMNGPQSAGESNNYAKADHVHPSDTSKVDKVSGKGLSTNDFTNNYKSSLDSINSSYSNALSQIANLTANKLDKRQTDYKGKNVVVHSTTGEITFEDKNNHTHTVSNITDFPPIIEEIPFYWVDDFLTYASNSYNIFYDPNNDVQYLVEFINSNNNNSSFTSNDIKTDRLYQIPYGSSYTHDICVAFTYDEVNEEYNARYITTNERYATLYELSLKATSSDISSAISTHDGNNSAHNDIRQAIPSASSTTPSADTTNGSIGDSSNYAKADHTHPKSTLYAEASHSHDINNITGLQTALDNKLNTTNLSAQLETIVQNLINEANQS